MRPHSIVIACGDGNLYLTGIHWRTWNAVTAAGSATAHQNDCTPYCAAGRFHTYPATVALSQPKSCKGTVVFTRITWHARGKTQSTEFGCSS